MWFCQTIFWYDLTDALFELTGGPLQIDGMF